MLSSKPVQKDTSTSRNPGAKPALAFSTSSSSSSSSSRTSVAKSKELDRAQSSGNLRPIVAPSNAAASSSSAARPRSVIIDHQVNNYRYNIRPNSIFKFPNNNNNNDDPSTKPTIAVQPPAAGAKLGDNHTTSLMSERTTLLQPKPTRARANNTRVLTDIDSPSPSEPPSRASSRAGSRRLSYLQLPTDPSAPGPWSAPKKRDSTISDQLVQVGQPTLPPPPSPPARPNSKILTTFPFPHPSTPAGSKYMGSSAEADGCEAGLKPSGVIARSFSRFESWLRSGANLFAGPHERRLNAEERHDDEITRSILETIAQGAHRRRQSWLGSPTPGDRIGRPAAARGVGKYGSLWNGGGGEGEREGKTGSILPTACPPSPTLVPSSSSSPLIFPSTHKKNFGSSLTSLSSYDPQDPYGYRRLAGPHLLPSYSTDLATRRRERRRARSLARFQCMALWIVWTVSLLLLFIVIGCVISFWDDIHLHETLESIYHYLESLF